MKDDPVTSLIDALNSVQKQNPAPSAVPQDRLAQVADMIPQRSPTAVPDVNRSRLLDEFRKQYQRGLIEARLVEGLFELIRELLVLKGLSL